MGLFKYSVIEFLKDLFITKIPDEIMNHRRSFWQGRDRPDPNRKVTRYKGLEGRSFSDLSEDERRYHTLRSLSGYSVSGRKCGYDQNLERYWVDEVEMVDE